MNDNVYVDSLISEKLRTRKGDILICSRNGSRNLIGKNCLITPEVEGKTWGVFMSLYRSKNPYFLYWILNSPIFESQSGLYLTSTINQLTVSTLENLVVPFTEDELEQHQIVKYLDEKTTIIDTLIEKTQQKIDTLKELRSSLINKVVTKGLDPNVEMKDSGVEWIGEIPKHWNLKKVKFLLNDFDGIKIGPFGSSLKLETLTDSGIKIYGQGNVIKDDFTLGDRYLTVEKFESEFSQYEILNGDVLVTMMGTTGKCKVFSSIYEKGILDSHLLRLRFNPTKLNSVIFSILLEDSNYIFQQLKLNSKGSIMEGLNSSIVKELSIVTPPIEEQEILLTYIQNQTQLIDTSIQNEQLRIEKLKEYRQSLISDVVTGKIKVTEYE